MNGVDIGGASLSDALFQDTRFAVLQIKGWGSGVTLDDLRGFAGHASGAEDPTCDDFVAFCGKLLRQLGVLEVGKPVLVQWDGDCLDGTFGHFVVGIVHALADAHMLHGTLCTKLTTLSKAPNFAAKFVAEKGGHNLVCVRDVPHAFVAYPYEEDSDVQAAQRATRFGHYGHTINHMFSQELFVVAFGGGDVLRREHSLGLRATAIFCYTGLTRRGLTETTTFGDLPDVAALEPVV